MLPIPAYIQSSGIAIRDVPYEWDEWRVKDYYMYVESKQFARLDLLTNKANTGLTIAAGEWICHRFSLLSQDPAPLQFLEAAWAGIIHPAYCIYTETEDDEWRGPVREPLAVMIAITNDALFCLRDDPHVATRACWMYNLARHVLPSTGAFEAWFLACIARLEQHHTKAIEHVTDETDLFDDFPGQGAPVPRQAFDPGFDYLPSDAPRLLDAFLRSHAEDTNPYLRPTAELPT
jgi:hypothetical protein